MPRAKREVTRRVSSCTFKMLCYQRTEHTWHTKQREPFPSGTSVLRFTIREIRLGRSVARERAAILCANQRAKARLRRQR